MPNIDILNGEIADLESKTLTFAVAERLAWLYIVRDHCCIGKAQSPAEQVESMPLMVEYSSDTDFSRAINGRDLSDVWPVIDELMTTLQIVQPRLYDGVMQRLQ